MAWRLCPGCGRRIEESIFARASSHAPGCTARRSALAKAAYQRKRVREDRRRQRAEERRRRAGAAGS